MISDASKWLFSLAAALGLGTLGAQALGLDVTAVLVLAAAASAALAGALVATVARDGQPVNAFQSTDPRDGPAGASLAPFAFAAAGVAVAGGIAINRAWATVGWALLALAALYWLATSIVESASQAGARARDAFTRFEEPTLAPLAGLAGVALVVAALSRVLLTASKEGATAVALGAAVAVMAGAAFVATRRSFPYKTMAAGVGVLLATVLVAGAISGNRGERVFHPEHPTEVELVAEGTAFQVKDLAAEIDQRDGRVLIRFVNLDQDVLHNLAVYSDPEYTNRVATGSVFKGSDQRDELVVVGPVEPGTYYFRCDMHTTAMVGELTLTAATEENAEHAAGEE